MVLKAFLTWIPSILESKDQNHYFEPVIFNKCNEKITKTGENVPIKHAVNSVDKTSFSKSNKDKKKEKQEKSLLDSFDKKINKKYQYLSSHMVETNGHVLGLYKKLKKLEEDHLKDIRSEIENLSHRLTQIEEKSMQDTNANGQLNSQTDIVYLYHKLEKLSERLSQVESKSKEKKEVSCSYIPVLSDQADGGRSQAVSMIEESLVSSSSISSITLQSSLLKFMLPSVVTVTAVVINMYLYLSSSRKFPM